MARLKKGLYWTDIHWGKKSNSPTHLADCHNFIKWVHDIAHIRPDIDYLAFLGDWFENRTSISVNTLHAAYEAAKMLNDLNIPVYFVVGNHDLYLRNSRDVYSVAQYAEFDNFHVISSPTVIGSDIVHDGMLLVPYMFHDEYHALQEYSDVPVWAGHFEFQGFRITGYNTRMEHGPDPLQFQQQRRILSGHFHARQTQRNVTYIGNAFPMDYGDVGDRDRGCAVYDHTNNSIEFINWDNAPSYNRYLLSDIQHDPSIVRPGSYVKCVVDVPIEYEASVELKQQLLLNLSLREFVFEDVIKDDILNDTVVDEQEVVVGATMDQTIVSLLGKINDDSIDTSLLVSEYQKLS